MLINVLLDECLPRRLKKELGGHKVSTVPEMGWAGKKNGELLRLAVSAFDVFITFDQNLPYQQNLKNAPLAVILLSAKDNSFETLKPLIPRLRQALRNPKKSDFLLIEA